MRLRLGLAPVLLGALLVLSAGLFDAEALWVPGAGLLVLWGLLIAGLELTARGARVERRLGAARVVEGEELDVRVRAHTGRLPLAAGELAATEGGAPVARLPAGRREAAGDRRVALPRRGRAVLPPPELRLSDPLGLARRVVSGPDADEVLVLPRLEPVRTPAGGTGLALGGDAGRGAAPGAESEWDGLRPYRPGTPATRIHWPALARGAGLVERRMLADAERRPLVALDPEHPVSPGALDAAVRAAASLAVALAEGGGCAVLLPGDRRPAVLEPGLLAWPALHARLALVEAGPGPALGGHAHRHRTLVLVAARIPARAPAPLVGGPRGVRILVVPGAWGTAAPVLEVAGCRGYAVRATGTPSSPEGSSAVSVRREPAIG